MSDKKSNKTRDLPVSLTALKILEIIKEESDIDHPISQAEIARRLGVDRKTVSRCLDVIGDIDGEIVRSKSGVYLIPSRSAFELSEIRLLIDSVLASKVISAEQTDAIVKKLSKLLNRHDRAHIRHIHSYKDWSKIDNKHVFWTVEVLDDAINKSCAVSFDYNEIGLDKLLHVLESYTVFPLQLAFSRGQYFLLAESDEECGIRSFRIDKITNAKIKERLKRKISERPIRDIASSYVEGHPYMSFGESERITLIIESAEIGRVFDVFGTRVSVAPCKENGEKYATMVEVSFVANTEDVYRFMQIGRAHV